MSQENFFHLLAQILHAEAQPTLTYWLPTVGWAIWPVKTRPQYDL